MSNPKLIDGFVPRGGKHCITNSLKQIFEYNGKPLTESMIFGLGEGLNFMYINLADSPMISGRCKPFVFEEILATNLGINIKCKSSKNTERVHANTIRSLKEGNPVMVYADMAFLEYLGVDGHFGGHSVIIMGYDDAEKVYFVSDRDNEDYEIRSQRGMLSRDYHLVSYESMEKARSSKFRPFPANNKWLEFDFAGFIGVDKLTLLKAIRNSCQNMLQPETKMLGITGIEKFSKEIRKWVKFDDEKLKLAAITNFFMISKDGGTGGGAFRRMFGEFLIESSEITGLSALKESGEEFLKISILWDRVADKLWSISESCDRNILGEISDMLGRIYEMEMKEYLLLQAIL